MIIVSSIITLPYLMPAKEVKGYYVKSYTSYEVGSYPRIYIIIENGGDERSRALRSAGLNTTKLNLKHIILIIWKMLI